MAYTPINNGDTGLDARNKINGIGTGLDVHSNNSGSLVHGLGTISTQSASLVAITRGCVVVQNARFGTGIDYTAFDEFGNLVMSGSATVWDDIFFPLATAKQGQQDKPAFDTTEVAYLFPQGDTTSVMYILAQFPHSMKVGSSIKPHVHWKQTQSGSVVFKMDYKWFDIGSPIPANFQTYVMNVATQAYTSGSIHQLTTGSASISGSSITKVSSMMLIKLYRDDNTYTGNAVTYQMDIHVERDTLGSREEHSK